MTIVWQSHARLRLPHFSTSTPFSSERNDLRLYYHVWSSVPIPMGKRAQRPITQKKKETPAYELGARDSIPILARHQLLIIARGRSSPGGWTLGFAGAITIWLDRIENKRREFVRNFSTNGRIVLHQRRLTLHQQSGSIRGIHLLTLSKLPRQSFINYSLNEKEKTIR